MRITDFSNFIREIPYNYQSFDIKRDVWKNLLHDNFIDRIFEGNDIISISRYDLFNSVGNMEEFIIKVLMWGYPTKGRGKNIENLLNASNFDKLNSILAMSFHKGTITIDEIKELLKIDGLGLSTLSKFLYFMRLKIDSLTTLILDQRVISTLNSGKYSDPEIEKFGSLKYENAIDFYFDYLSFSHELAKQINAEIDQIEMFLFEYGSNLKVPKEEGM